MFWLGPLAPQMHVFWLGPLAPQMHVFWLGPRVLVGTPGTKGARVLVGTHGTKGARVLVGTPGTKCAMHVFWLGPLAPSHQRCTCFGWDPCPHQRSQRCKHISNSDTAPYCAALRNLIFLTCDRSPRQTSRSRWQPSSPARHVMGYVGQRILNPYTTFSEKPY